MRRWIKWVMAVGLLVIGVAISLVVFVLLRAAQIKPVRTDFVERGQELIGEIEFELTRELSEVQALAAFIDNSIEVTEQEFVGFASSIGARSGGLVALEWVPAVRADQLEETVAAGRQNHPEYAVFEMDERGIRRPVGERPIYYPIFYSHPLSESIEYLGFDLGSEPRRIAALSRARDLGEQVISDIVRIEGREAVDSIRVVQPIYTKGKDLSGVAARREALEGFAVGVIYLKGVVLEALKVTRTAGFRINIRDVTSPDSPVVSFRVSEEMPLSVSQRDYQLGKEPRSRIETKRLLDVGGREWEVVVGAEKAYIARRTSWTPEWLLVVMLLGALTGAALVWVTVDRFERLNKVKNRIYDLYRAKGEFIGQFSHDLRVPVASMVGYAEIVEEEACDLTPEQIKSDMARIQSAGVTLVEMLDNLVESARLEVGEIAPSYEEVSLDESLSQIVDTVGPLVRANNNQLHFEKGGKIGQARIDLPKVRRILINLLSNAAKFTKDGQVRLRVKAVEEKGREWLVFMIFDTGEGMSRVEANRIFERYVQGSAGRGKIHGGSGLGLAVVQEFCRLMGGTVTVETAPGKGSCFTVRIPRWGE